MEETLKFLLPSIISESEFQIITFQGKPNLLKNLESRLTAYSKWVPDDYYFVVIVDRDNDDCYQLKNNLDEICLRAGLIPKSRAKNIGRRYNVLIRIAIEELESWFIGDPTALRLAYPKLPGSFENNSRFRDPDSITGGTSESLERLLQTKGYFSTGLAKISLAIKVAPLMSLDNNRSRSFNVLIDGLRDLQ